MGSVKDLTIIKSPTAEKMGIGRFNFSNRYSVFDWGEMPDLIPGKGASLCLISAYFFEKLNSVGIKNHYRALYSNGEPVKLRNIKKPVNIMEVDLVRVVEPNFSNRKYDYSNIKELRKNYLIPLEIIYRFSLPAGSSVFKRINRGEISYKDMGLISYPEPGAKLPEPFIDFSTKLESFDRYLNRNEALTISGLEKKTFNLMVEKTKEIALLIKETYERAGIFNDDGKLEFAVDDKGDLLVVDALGTPDECRFTKNGISLSKETARQFYRNSAWSKHVESAKDKHGKEWKKHVVSNPEPLSKEKLNLLSELYKSLANRIIEKDIFKNIPQIDSIISKISSTEN